MMSIILNMLNEEQSNFKIDTVSTQKNTIHLKGKIHFFMGDVLIKKNQYGSYEVFFGSLNNNGFKEDKNFKSFQVRFESSIISKIVEETSVNVFKRHAS